MTYAVVSRATVYGFGIKRHSWCNSWLKKPALYPICGVVDYDTFGVNSQEKGTLQCVVPTITPYLGSNSRYVTQEAVMDRDKIYEDLVNRVNAELEAGKSKTEIVDLLVQIGIAKEKAPGLVDIVVKSRTSNAKRVGRFFALAIFPVAILILSAALNADPVTLVSLIGPALMTLVVSVSAFFALQMLASRRALFGRCVAGWLMFASSAALSGIMFVHPGWNTGKAFLLGNGNPLAVVLRIFHHLGPQGVAWALLVLSAILLLNFWSACHKWRTGEE